MKNLRPNNFLFPIPKRDSGSLGAQTFFAGRGKRGDDSEPSFDALIAGHGMKRAYDEADVEDWSAFFAGRGRRADEQAPPPDMTFFAGRG